MRAIGGLVKFLMSAATLLVILGAVMRVGFVDVYDVTHNGMAPTLVAGDQVLLWRHASADLSNVMVCEHPADPTRTVLGRAVAFAGHVVTTDRYGNLYVDSDHANLEPVDTVQFYDVTRSRLITMNLGRIEYYRGRGHYFFVEEGTTFSLTPYQVNHGAYLLGDNRADAVDDSREFGEIDPAKCKGQVFMRLRPAPSNNDDIHHGYFAIIP